MTDPTHSFADDGFVGSSDHAKAGFKRDERIITATTTPKPDAWDFGPGDNLFFVLPSSADFATWFPDRYKEYKLGQPYVRIAVQRVGSKKPQYMTVSDKQNPLTKAYWRLSESLKGNKVLWDGITSGFQAGTENRRMMQVVRMNARGELSPAKLWSVGDENGRDPKPGQKLPLYLLVRDALATVYKAMVARGTPMMPFFPQTATLLKVQVSFRGTIPQYDVVAPYLSADMQFHHRDLSAIWEACDKDAAFKWVQVLEDLPDLTQIETVIKSPQACQILGLPMPQMGYQPQAGQGYPPGAQTPPMAQAPTFNPPMQAQPPMAAGTPPAALAAVPSAPFVPQQGAPVGFGVPQGVPATVVPGATQGTPVAPVAAPVTFVPQGVPAAAPAAFVPQPTPMAPPAAQAPFVPQAASATPGAPVNPTQPNPAAAGAAFAAQLQVEIAKRQVPPGGPPF